MILSFKKQFPWGTPTDFEQKILSGSKIHTIREDPNGRWKPGRKAHLANGVRTKNYRCFKEDVCRSVQPIIINHYPGYTPELEVIIDDDCVFRQGGALSIGYEFMEKLAKNDGFDSVEDFFKWFSTDTKPNTFIIHWTEFRY